MVQGSIAATRVMLTHTPEGNVPGNLRETGPGLQLTEEDWIPSQLSILNLTISLQMILSHKQARLPSLEQAILLMVAAPLRNFMSLHTMLTPTPEGKVPGSLSETGKGL